VVPGPRTEAEPYRDQYADRYTEEFTEPVQQPLPEPAPVFTAEDQEFSELAYPLFRTYVDQYGDYPKVEQFEIHLADGHGIRHPRSASLLRRLYPEFKARHQADLESEHIA
jgi:hypothetical protein